MSVDRRNRPSAGWLRSAVVCGTLLAAAALSVPGAQLAAARPYDPPAAAPVPLGDLLKQLQTLYAQTESATESYDRARENADTLRKRAASIDAQLAAQRVKLAAGRDEAGLMARQMYQDGGVSPYLSLLGGQTPEASAVIGTPATVSVPEKLVCTSTPTVQEPRSPRSTRRDALPMPPLKPSAAVPLPAPTQPCSTGSSVAVRSASKTCASVIGLLRMSERCPSFVSPTIGLSDSTASLPGVPIT